MSQQHGTSAEDGQATLVRFQHVSPSLRAHAGKHHLHHVLFDFRLENDRQPTQTHLDAVVGCLTAYSGLDLSVSGPLPTTSTDDQLSSFGALLSDSKGNRATVTCFAFGLITLDMVLIVKDAGLSDASLEKLRRSIEAALSEPTAADEQGGRPFKGRSTMLPPIVRGGRFDPYVATADGLLIQYDFDEAVFDEYSPYQHVQIFHSNQFGNVLILDHDVNMAESDLSYTKAILGGERYSYAGKNVLILGGGDGGILHEVLKLNPAKVLMLELDEMVVNACRKHLRGVCYDSMDKLCGDNYEIKLGDCLPVLQELGQTGTQFDFIINDLTAVPVTASATGSDWDFIRLVLDLSMKVMAPTGYFITQGNSFNMTRALGMYEEILGQLEPAVAFDKDVVTVPSYHEQWVFYRVWLKSNADGH